MVEYQKVRRLGTVKLLDLTKGLPPDKMNELLTYIGQLERSEDFIYDKVVGFAKNFINFDKERWY